MQKSEDNLVTKDLKHVQLLRDKARNTINRDTERFFIEKIAEIGTEEAMDVLFDLGTGSGIHNNVLCVELAMEIRKKLLKSKGPLIVKGAIDEQLYDRCVGKDYHDVSNNAFPILEDRIRDLISSHEHGLRLIDEALNPKTGKLSIGKTEAESEGVYLLFRGAVGYLRNPPAHTMKGSLGQTEAYNLMCFVDLLLRLLQNAKLNS